MPTRTKDKTAKRSSVRVCLQFGRAIEHARRQKGFTQEELAQKLSGPALSDNVPVQHWSQSYIARLEKGQATDPHADVIRAVAHVLDVSADYLLSRLISDKYGIAIDKASILDRSLLSLDEIALWEQRLEHKELWIVATEYVDDRHPSFSKAVTHKVAQGDKLVFFISQEQEMRFRAYGNRVLEQASLSIGTDGIGQISYIPLHMEEVAVMAASYAIANPLTELADEVFPCGYLILNGQDGSPLIGLKMYRTELMMKIIFLRELIRERAIHLHDRAE